MTDEKNHRKIVGRRLQGRRDREGWSREQVAEMTGYSLDTIRKVEEGSFNVPVDVLGRIADIYGCDIYFMKKPTNK
mgnify:CR=1 FL=1